MSLSVILAKGQKLEEYVLVRPLLNRTADTNGLPPHLKSMAWGLGKQFSALCPLFALIGKVVWFTSGRGFFPDMVVIVTVGDLCGTYGGHQLSISCHHPVPSIFN